MKNMQLICKPIMNGIMVLWGGSDDAARYIVTLYINDIDISTRIAERSEKYCSFIGLADIRKTDVKAVLPDGANRMDANNCDPSDRSFSGITRSTPTQANYYVSVQAEDRNGNVIAQSDKVMCRIHASDIIEKI